MEGAANAVKARGRQVQLQADNNKTAADSVEASTHPHEAIPVDGGEELVPLHILGAFETCPTNPTPNPIPISTPAPVPSNKANTQQKEGSGQGAATISSPPQPVHQASKHTVLTAADTVLNHTYIRFVLL